MSEPFRGQIRKEDVRAVEKDRVEMYRSFRWPNFQLKLYHFVVFIYIVAVFTRFYTFLWEKSVPLTRYPPATPVLVPFLECISYF